MRSRISAHLRNCASYCYGAPICTGDRMRNLRKKNARARPVVLAYKKKRGVSRCLKSYCCKILPPFVLYVKISRLLGVNIKREFGEDGETLAPIWEEHKSVIYISSCGITLTFGLFYSDCFYYRWNTPSMIRKSFKKFYLPLNIVGNPPLSYWGPPPFARAEWTC